MNDPTVDFDDHGGRLVVTIRGDLDLACAASVLAAIEVRLLPRHRRAVVDLTGVDYLDSAGVHLLFQLGRYLDERGQGLLLVVPEASVAASTLRHAGALDAFPACPTADAALAE